MPLQRIAAGAGVDPLGGKGGKGSPASLPVYYCDLYYLLTENQIGDVLRVFSDGKLTWTGKVGSGTTNILGSEANGLWSRLTFYNGAADQLPDVNYEASIGVGLAPAYRGRSTVFVEGLDIGYNGSVPNLTFEVAQSSTVSSPISVYGTFPALPGGGLADGQQGVMFTATAAYHYQTHRQSGVSAEYLSWKSFKVTRGGTYATLFSGLFPANTVQTASWAYSSSSVNCSGGAPRMFSRGEVGFGPTQNGHHRYYVHFLTNGVGRNVLSFNSGNADGNDIVPGLTTHVAYDHLYDMYVVFAAYPATYPADSNRCLQGTIFTGTAKDALVVSDGVRTEAVPYPGGPVAFYNKIIYVLSCDGNRTRVRRYTDAGVFIDESEPTPELVPHGGAAIKANAEGLYVRSYAHPLLLVYKLVDGTFGGNTWELKLRDNSGSFSGMENTKDFYATDTSLTYTLSDSATVTVRSVLYAASSANTRTVQDVVTELCTRAGLSANQFDATALSVITRPVYGFKATQVTNVRVLLETLAAAYFFDVTLSDKLYFAPKGRSSLLTIPYASLGAGEDTAQEVPFTLEMTNTLEVPDQTTVTFIDVNADYEANTQYSYTLSESSPTLSQVQVPLVLTASDGKIIADVAQASVGISTLTSSVSLTKKYIEYEVGDTVTIVDKDNRSYIMRITKVEWGGPTVKWMLVFDDPSIFTQLGYTTASAGQVTEVRTVVPTVFTILDVPLLMDTEPNYGLWVVAGGQSSWQGCQIFRSYDSYVYDLQDTSNTQGTFGAATTALPLWTGPAIFDEVNSVQVRMVLGTLSSTTREEILANRNLNLAVLGAELIQFKTATLDSPGVYTLTGLLRGRRGTEGVASGLYGNVVSSANTPLATVQQHTGTFKYLLIPSSDFVDRSATNYNESGFSTGPGPFGNGPHPISPLSSIVPVTNWASNSKIWLRTRHNVIVGTRVTVTAWVDNGYTMYLDGVALVPVSTAAWVANYSFLATTPTITLALTVEDVGSSTYASYKVDLQPLTFGHSVGENFVLYTLAGWTKNTLQNSDIGRVLNYKAVSFNSDLASTGALSGVPQAVSARCYTPVDLRASFSGDTRTAVDTTLSWTRRTRFSTTFASSPNIPLGESSEEYELEIWDSSFTTLKRTVTGLAVPNYTYTNAQQVTDFGAGQSVLYVRVYQVNSLIGRGFRLSATV